MLSYIVRITNDYQSEHGYPPNTLILSKQHMYKLSGEYLDVDVELLLQELDLNLLVVQENGHPRVCWFDRAGKQVTAANC